MSAEGLTSDSGRAYSDRMKTRVTGIGGIFFKAKNPGKLGAWYRKRLGIPVENWGGWSFAWRDVRDARRKGATVWSPFEADTDYFAPSRKPFMLNFRVEDLDAVLAALRSEGVRVIPKIEESEFGRFGWILDPEGTKVELWEPPAGRRRRRAKSKTRARD